ncbi:MAG: tetratricopeptide repeat protein [Kibdelosporangium sp.]
MVIVSPVWTRGCGRRGVPFRRARPAGRRLIAASAEVGQGHGRSAAAIRSRSPEALKMRTNCDDYPSSMGTTGALALAQVMAHCGGNPAEAVRYLSYAIAEAPHDPGPYATLAELRQTSPAETTAALESGGLLGTIAAYAHAMFLDGEMDEAVMLLGTVVGHHPQIAWADAPWFSEPSFAESVSADALAEAALRTMDHGHDLAACLPHFEPWFRLMGAVCTRDPKPTAMARMARLFRNCGRTDDAFALCDRADAVEPVMETTVVRAVTWRGLGDNAKAVLAFEHAITLEPDNWSLYLDLADTHADQGDFTAAVAATERGLQHEPDELTLRAASAAYRARLHGCAADLAELIELAPELPNEQYGGLLIGIACEGRGLPADLIASALDMSTT